MPPSADMLGGAAPFVMYGATVRALPFAGQCAVAAAIGCDAITLSPTDYLNHLNRGTTTSELRAIAADHGISITHLDMLARWSPHWVPDDYEGQYPLSVIAYDMDDFFRMAGGLGCRSFTAVGTYPKGSMSLAETVDHFGALCRRAAVEGLRVDLEFAPFWGTASLTDAWDILRRTNAANSGLMFDVWHHRRSGSSDALLATIPGRWITGVQLNDGPTVAPAGMTLTQECLGGRLPPGEGDFDTRAIVRILRETGGLNNLGPEIFSTELDRMPAAAIIDRCRESLAAVLC